MPGAADDSGLGSPTRRIFISYSREDYYFAEELRNRLVAEGFEVWFDDYELVAGIDWAEEIDRALWVADGFVLVSSPAAMESSYVASEWRRAIERCKSVFVVTFRRTALPAELACCPTYRLPVDPANGTGRLGAALGTSGQERDIGGRSRSLRKGVSLPPVI